MANYIQLIFFEKTFLILEIFFWTYYTKSNTTIKGAHHFFVRNVIFFIHLKIFKILIEERFKFKLNFFV